VDQADAAVTVWPAARPKSSSDRKVLSDPKLVVLIVALPVARTMPRSRSIASDTARTTRSVVV
jgi:hypothetical protein